MQLKKLFWNDGGVNNVENKFVDYLNTLHNYYGQNSNVFGESNINNDFYKEIMVDIPICNFISKELKNECPHIVILTGHAGDGKTSLMYQVLKSLGCEFDVNKKSFSVELENGKKCLCIKDFSEFSDQQKRKLMEEVVTAQKNGKYVFMVANTGPLIKNFPYAFPDELYEDVQTKLIELLDNNTGKIQNIFDVKISIINIVAVDNTYFAKKFIDNVIEEKLWENCLRCDKREYCPIIKNIGLIKQNEEKVTDFITKHYRWLLEYGERFTIRSMTQQLSYMITGGIECDDVIEEPSYIYLCSNLFFGYLGTRIDDRALSINAIKASLKCNYDKKRLRRDEDIFIDKSWKSLFSKEIVKIITDSEINAGRIDGWQEMIKRMYLFFNIQTDSEAIKCDLEDVFSIQFNRYLELKYLNHCPTLSDHLLVRNALFMLNLGTIKYNSKEIPITLSRESGYVQNVQYVVGTIKTSKIKLIAQPSKHSAYLGDEQYKDLFIQIDGKILHRNIDLPLLDYFEDLKNGIIDTNIDAQLSKEIESIKSEILPIAKDEEDDMFTLIVDTNEGYDEISFNISEGIFKLE